MISSTVTDKGQDQHRSGCHSHGASNMDCLNHGWLLVLRCPQCSILGSTGLHPRHRLDLARSNRLHHLRIPLLHSAFGAQRYTWCSSPCPFPGRNAFIFWMVLCSIRHHCPHDNGSLLARNPDLYRLHSSNADDPSHLALLPRHPKSHS